MIVQLRRTLFAIYAVVFRLPVWGLIWLVGHTGIIRTVFVIYPHDKKEYARLCPDHPLFVKWLSGRPTPGGVILDGWKPIGIYLYVSNTPQELVKKKNRHLAEAIVRRMRWVQKLAKAETCGFAGQLGPILERRHGIAMQAPFFTSTFGNIFSIDDTIKYLAKKKGKNPWQTSIAILGGGELGDSLHDHFSATGYQCRVVDMLFKRRGATELKDRAVAAEQLAEVDFVINLLATGDQFMKCGITGLLQVETVVIDFSRPPIPRDKVNVEVVMGNRVQRQNLRFAFALPEWGRNELPACSIPCIAASRFNIQARSSVEFCRAVRKIGFSTALAPVRVEQPAMLVSETGLLEDAAAHGTPQS